MVIGETAIAVRKWVNGKWIKTVAETATETVTKRHWVNGKWVKETPRIFEEGKVYSKMKPATSTVGTGTRPIVREAVHTRFPDLPEGVSLETASRGRWVNGKWVKEATQALKEGKVYTKIKPSASTVGTATSPIVREATHTRLPEGMLPEEMTTNDIQKLFNDRYYAMRYGRFPKKINPSAKREFYNTIKSNERGMYLEETDEWLYRKPNWMTDSIVSFKVIPKERISMNVNPDPELIRVLERYIAKGEVVKDGRLIRTVTPPKAYYKSTDVIEAYESRQDPITMYFREPATKDQIADIVEITTPFQAPSVATFPTGAVDGAHWLSYTKEHSPEDLYKLYKKAMKIDPKLGEAINRRVTIANHVKDIDYGKGLPYIERFRFRISEGQYQAIESVVNDFEKALGKTGFDRIM